MSPDKITLYGSIQSGIRDCARCSLARTRRNAVPGYGNVNAKVLLIGEAPGYQEDNSGEPFIGDAGNLLDKLLDGIGLDREDVFICNVVNCRPPNNRDPKQNELKECKSWLDEQIELVNPSIIVALGRFASLALCPGHAPKEIRGTARWADGRVHLFLFHPAAALHNPGLRPEMAEGFELLKSLI